MPKRVRLNGTKYIVYEIYESDIVVDEEHISIEGEPVLVEIPKGQDTGEVVKALGQLEHRLPLLDERYQKLKGYRKSGSIAYTIYRIYAHKEEIETKDTQLRRVFQLGKKHPIFVKIPRDSDGDKLSGALKRLRTKLVN